MKTTARVLFALLLAAAASAPALAGMRERSIEVGAYLLHAEFDSASNIEDDEGLGGRVGIVFAPRHEIEFAFDFVSTADNLDLGLDVDLTTFRIGYVYNLLPEAAVSPLLTIGGGWQRLELAEDRYGGHEVLDETDPLAYAGAGLRFFIGPVLNIRVEGQAVAVLPDGDTDDALIDGVFSVGVGWVLGGH